MSKYKLKIEVVVFNKKVIKDVDIIDDLGYSEDRAISLINNDEIIEDQLTDVIAEGTDCTMYKKVKGKWVKVIGIR